VEDSSEENHALALHTKKGAKFKRNFRQTFKGEKSSSNPGYQRRDVSEIQCFRYVTSMDTLQETVQPGRREDNMLPPLRLIQIHLKRVKIRERRNTSSKRT
jgi:hypothetical protein